MLNKFVLFFYLLLIFSLGFMQPSVSVYGFQVPPTDFIFLITFALWFLALIFRKTDFRWHNFYWILLLYFSAMILPTVFSENPTKSFVKLLSQIYLFGLAVLTVNLVRTKETAKKMIAVWLAATLIGCFIFLISAVLFYADRANPLLIYTLSHYGTLPPGNYPRLRGAFLNANMTCNYLNVGVAFLLVARKLNWINKTVFAFALALVLFSVLLTISPGIGGSLLVLGLWYWTVFQARNRNRLAIFCLSFAAISAIFFFVSTLVSPNPNSLAAFSFKLPFLDYTIYPSVRVLGWTAAIQTLLENPFFGRGLGLDAVSVFYYNAAGDLAFIGDAHQTWLNFAAQTGFYGLFAIIVLTFYLLRKRPTFKFGNNELKVFHAGFRLAFLGAFLYQGLFGSFEDARHLWILTGLLVSFSGDDLKD
jgi:putative inorganic carbon (hco3(-)) transporter